VVVGLVLAERLVSRRRVGQHGWSWSAGDALLTAGLVLAPGFALPLGAVAAVLAGDTRLLDRRKQGYNVAQELAATCLAVLATLTTTSLLGPLGAAAGSTVYFLANTTLVVVVLAAVGEQDIRTVAVEHLPAVGRSWLASASLGLAAAALVDRAWVAALLVVPLTVTHAEHRAQVRRADRERTLRRLHELVSLGDRSETSTLRAVCAVADDVLAPARARLVVGDGLGVVSWTTGEHDVVVNLDDADDLALIARLAASGERVLVADDRRTLCALLPDASAGTTALVLRAPHQTLPFTDGDVELARTIAISGGAILESARRGERERVATEALRDLARQAASWESDTARGQALRVEQEALAELRRL
jgi:hypothetical protein